MENEEVNRSFLTFRLGNELFAANVVKVHEILEIPRITKVPGSPEFMRGVINLRGSVLPAVDSRIKFNMPPQEDTVDSVIIVMSLEYMDQPLVMGAIVDAVQEVIEINQDDIKPAPKMGSKYKSEFIEGMVKHENQFIMLLNLDLVFSLDEVSILQEITSEGDSKSKESDKKKKENQPSN